MKGPGRESGSGRPVRVAVVAPSMDILGGQAVQAARLLDGLAEESGIDAFLVPINPRLPGPLAVLQKIKYVRTIVTSVVYVLRLLRAVPRADVVHVFSASYFSFVLAPTPAILLARALGKPTVLNYHSGEAEDHLHRWRRTAIPTILLATRIVVPSSYLVDVFEQFGLRAVEIWNSLDVDVFRYRHRERLEPVFLSNRNFQSHYGVDTILRAFARIAEAYPQARLLVAGYGPEDSKLRALARELRLANVEFLGKIPFSQMPDLYDRADVYLNASRIDNMPSSILEAFASGLPVVTSDAGGIPYIVDSGRTALVVPVDRPDLLADEALRLLETPGLAGKLSSEGRREVETKYRLEAILPEWIELYRDLAGSEGLVPSEMAGTPRHTKAGQ